MATNSVEHAKRIIGERIELFARNLDQYRQPDYKEAQLRREFLDPLFEALGWDVQNRQGWAEQYKEVVNEDALKIGGATKAPDYSFRIGGVRKFFAEAKKPALMVKTDAEAAYQLRRYAWSARLPLSVLTDFEELAIYDCRARPSHKDKASAGRVNLITFNQYLDRLSEIYDVFSKEAVLRGSFDRYIQEAKGKRGTTPVDAEFLKEIEEWRAVLAKNIATLNPRLTLDELNDAVQRTIDRIIFLRMAEDRGAEPYGRLRDLITSGKIYAELMRLCYDADAKYNSGLFDFSTDQLTPRIKIDDNKLGAILDDLYYPQSPYEFSVLSVDTLGNIYEQFLGKVIRLTPSHQARIEDKPEVKKAGGVYYTPTYIVDYIVKQTVGKLIEGKMPKEIENLRILDPACGSGSFLLGAYQLLLDHHLNWYVNSRDNKQSQNRIYESMTGWHLTTAEKKRILLNNIFGVDIDRQAVEVTKLSLLLKALEGENQETLGKQLALFKERALPNLDANIKCGNSLIGPDYFAGQMFTDPEELKRVNPFDWPGVHGFPEIMKAGGFDCVIGNPPYGAYLYEADKSYLMSKFKYQNYQLDSYLLFMEQSVEHLLKRGGLYGMIIPNPWLTNLLQKGIRRFVTNGTSMHEIVHFTFPVFPRVTVDTEIVILQKTPPKDWEAKVSIFESLEAFKGESSSGVKVIKHQQEKWRALDGEVINIFVTPQQEALAKKCKIVGVSLETLCEINVGIKPYQVGKGEPPQTAEVVRTRPFDSDRQLSKYHRRYLRGSDIDRYVIAPVEVRYIKYGPWLAEPRPAANFDAPIKILMRQTGDSLIGTLDTERYLCLNNMHVIVPKEEKPAPTHILGILNSKLLNWYYHTLNPEVGEALAEVKKTNIAILPIRVIMFADAADKSRHDRLVALVEQMLELHKHMHVAKTQADFELYQRQIDATEKQIDALVYELYGLTEEEIKIVEDNST